MPYCQGIYALRGIKRCHPKVAIGKSLIRLGKDYWQSPVAPALRVTVTG